MLTTYIIGCIALIIKPGPDILCLLATAIAEGRARAATLMTGLILGCWFWILLLAAGVASFFVAYPLVMTAIQLVGAGYIATLAYGSLKEGFHERRHPGKFDLHPATAKSWRLVGRGIAMSMSNPLTILFFLAFLPHFTMAESSLSPALQTFLLGTLFCLLVPVIDVPIIFATDAFRRLFLNTRNFSANLKLVAGSLLALVVLFLLSQVRF